jgi:hypothetical protein
VQHHRDGRGTIIGYRAQEGRERVLVWRVSPREKCVVEGALTLLFIYTY